MRVLHPPTLFHHLDIPNMFGCFAADKIKLIHQIMESKPQNHRRWKGPPGYHLVQHSR